MRVVKAELVTGTMFNLVVLHWFVSDNWIL